MAKVKTLIEEYTDYTTQYSSDSSPTTNKFNLAKKDFELFKEETPNGDIFEAKFEDGKINAKVNRKILFSVDLSLLPDEDALFLRSNDGFVFVINSLKNKIKTQEDFRCLLDNR